MKKDEISKRNFLLKWRSRRKDSINTAKIKRNRGLGKKKRG